MALAMASLQIENGPQRKLLGARKRRSSHDVSEDQVMKTSKYFRQSDEDIQRSVKDDNVTPQTMATTTETKGQRGQEQGWFENSFSSGRRSSKGKKIQLTNGEQKPPGKSSEQDSTDKNSERDFFEESFQDSDFLSHVESIESQNSIDFLDTVTEVPSDGVSVSNEQVKKGCLILSPKNRPHGNMEVFVTENCRKDIQSDDSIRKIQSTKQESVCDRISKLEPNPQSSVCNENMDKEVKDSAQRATNQLKSEEVLNSVNSVGSLRDRLKRKLLQNVGTKAPVSPAQTIEQGKRSRLKEVEHEAAIIQGEGSANDIGPFYGLPSKVQQLLQNQRGIISLYEWQDKCLRLPTLQRGGNLVYSLPTSGGKTLVAEVLILKEILCRKKDAMMILPFVSIVQEKVKGMAQLAVELDFLVEEYAGSKGKFPPIKHRKKSLYIATIEKAHSLVNSLIEQGRLESLGLVVVDELHMIGEGRNRGSRLEATLLKIIYAKASTQIIGMSATLNNITDLLTFLKADIFSSDFRPVKLTEHVKLEHNIFEVQKGQTLQESLSHQRTVTFQYSPEMNKVDPDHLLGLVTEVVPQHSCLIFCSTKKNCENVALMLSKLMAKHKRELSQVKRQERKELLKELYKDGEQRMCPVLQHTIHFGLAYHHSGLTTDERHLLEEAYADGVLCLLACTSTLAAGVNLPAKRVILRNPYIGREFLNRSQYKQMIGRAGRAGKDTTGESILIVSPKDRCKVWEIISGPLENCYSSLNYEDGKGIRSLILSTIGLQVTKTTEEVFDMMTHTLLSIQASQLSCDIVAITKDALQQLIDMGLVRQKRMLSQDEENSSLPHTLEVTPLGRATFKGSVDLDFSAQLYKDLKKAEESLVLASYLHLLFLVTPYDLVKDVQPPWMTYFKQISMLTPVELKVAELIGVLESYIAKKASGQYTRQVVDEFVVRRFYLTLMLYDLWKQRSLWEVAEKFEHPRGFVQNLLSGAASFATCVYHFCQELEEFWAYQELLGTFVKRLAYCVSAELLPLMEIPGVKLGRAKQLYSAGFQSVASVAAADPAVLVRTIQQIPRKVAKQIIASAKVLLNERAEALLQEVEELVTVPVDRSTIQSSQVLTSPWDDMDLFSSIDMQSSSS